jgi:copper chaperone CopZ
MRTLDLHTPGASCGGCRDKIAATFAEVPGVESAVLDLDTNHTAVAYDPAQIDEATIVATLTEAGYPPAATQA